jgi:FkbM family methyltransferase
VFQFAHSFAPVEGISSASRHIRAGLFGSTVVLMMSVLERFLMTASCRDADSIAKVPNAGQVLIVDGIALQVMHDGTKVLAGGYHGDWMADVIRSLRGHHEPQEELLFHHLLRYVRQRSTFVELGAFWAYYTLWYLGSIPFSRALCIEPDENNMKVGQHNLKLNAREARFVNAVVGRQFSPTVEFVRESDRRCVQIPCFDMDAVLQAAETSCIEVLHMDVQGAELPFIQSMANAVSEGKVRFVVVSTHHETISGSRTTHSDCLLELAAMGGTIHCEHKVDESFSGDGLIVASFFPCDRSLALPNISRNKAATSLFR